MSKQKKYLVFGQGDTFGLFSTITTTNAANQIGQFEFIQNAVDGGQSNSFNGIGDHIFVLIDGQFNGFSQNIVHLVVDNTFTQNTFNIRFNITDVGTDFQGLQLQFAGQNTQRVFHNTPDLHILDGEFSGTSTDHVDGETSLLQHQLEIVQSINIDIVEDETESDFAGDGIDLHFSDIEIVQAIQTEVIDGTNQTDSGVVNVDFLVVDLEGSQWWNAQAGETARHLIANTFDDIDNGAGDGTIS